MEVSMGQFGRGIGLVLVLGLASAGCSDDSNGGGGDAGSAGSGGVAGGASSSRFVAVPIGTLAKSLAESKATHDAIASGGEAAAKQAGDEGHAVFLGTTLLGTTENELAAIDNWSSDANMDAFYGNPDFQAAFGSLFSEQPFFGSYECSSDWHTWGTLDAGKGSDRWIVIVRGKLKESDPTKARAAHDAVAAAGENDAKAAGDIAHIACFGRADPQEFLAIDIWSDPANIESLYTDPAFGAAFGALFDAQPELGVYASTDWHQW
jgi:quinol monooxygenase YgiN